MTPSIMTSKTTPQRVSSDSPSVSSPTTSSPRTSFSFSRTGSSDSPKFLSRMCSSRSRSPFPRTGVCNPTAAPATDEKPLHIRTDSGLSTSSNAPASPPFRPRVQKRNSGTTMQVGRHGNDWLFGGFSFTDAVKSMLGDGGRE